MKDAPQGSDRTAQYTPSFTMPGSLLCCNSCRCRRAARWWQVTRSVPLTYVQPFMQLHVVRVMRAWSLQAYLVDEKQHP
jgi:hypothetical protein